MRKMTLSAHAQRALRLTARDRTRPPRREVHSRHGETGAAHIVCALLAALATQARPLHAQSAGGHGLVLHGCVTDDYPAMVCAVSPTDPNGVPLTGLRPEAFTVRIDGNVVPAKSVSEARDDARATSTLLLLDISRSLSGKYVETLRQATALSMRDKPINERVGMIALTGKIEMPASADNIPLDDARESGFTTDANKAVVNKLQTVTPSRGTPLHDALNKALLMTSKEPFGARAVVVMSDGVDVSSTAEKIEFVIATARRFRIPVYAFGFGASRDEEKLKQIAVGTGGAYVPAASAADVAAAYRQIQNRLKSGYTVAFDAGNAERGDMQIEISVRLPDGQVVSAGETVRPAAPAVPQIRAVTVRSNGVDSALDAVPPGTLTFSPVIDAQAVERVEYQLDGGQPIVVDKEPFVLTLTEARVPPGKHNLLITVFGAAGRPERTVNQTIEFTVLPAAAPTGAPTPTVPAEPTPVVEPTRAAAGWTQTFTDNPLLLAALGVGVLALLTLLGLIAAVMIRRGKRSAGPVTDVIASPYAGSETGFTGVVETGFDNSQTGTQKQAVVQPARDDVTRVIVHEDVGQESPKTQVLQLAVAYLEVTNGANKGERVPIGMGGKVSVIVGRDSDRAAGDLRLSSPFVSRKHAEIKVDADGAMTVTDLGSSSGTKLNGVRLKANEAVKLDIGAELVFADVPAKILPPEGAVL